VEIMLARTERALLGAIAQADITDCPPRMAAAVRHAVFPGGARIRPRLCLSVANACGEDDPEASAAAAAAIELLHCASLVHDDLPCFDNAAIRRGKPSVHKAFGEPLAVLTGDALIVLAFQTLAQGTVRVPQRLPGLIRTVGNAVGMPAGIVAGQAWECEPNCDLVEYQRQKTGALFIAATVSGAQAAGFAPDRWDILGDRLGQAFQVADDLRDIVSDAGSIGKPTGQDAANGRPNAAAVMGVEGALRWLRQLIAEAVDSIPACPGAVDLRARIISETERFVPRQLMRSAA